MALNWSFKARLHNASDTMKGRYFALLDELNTYKGVKTSESWDKVRVYIGRQTYGAMIFRGKTLCLAMALNPSDYVDTKYVFDDISDVKKMADIPMLVRLSSDRQLKYLFELLETMFDGVDRVAADKIKDRKVAFYEKEQLIDMALIKVTASKKKGAAVEEEEDEPAPAPAPKKKEEPKEEPKKEEPKKEEPKKEEPKKEEPKPQPKPAPAPKKEAVATLPIFYEIPLCVKKGPKGIINLSAINNNFESGATVTPQALMDRGLLSEKVRVLKVLAGGHLDKPMKIAASEFSQEAKQAIKKAGGEMHIIKVIK